MNRRLIRKTLKIIGWTLLVIFVIATYLIYAFTSPSSEAEIKEKFEGDLRQPTITYTFFKGHNVRLVNMQKEIDSLLPTVFFVHGSPGSSMDFNKSF